MPGVWQWTITCEPTVRDWSEQIRDLERAVPELPEVETMVRGIRPVVEGACLTEVVLPPCDRKPIALHPGIQEIRRRVRGRRIAAVQRRAKRIVLQLDSDDAFVIEPRMTGLMLVANPPSQEHLRFEWRFGQGDGPLWFWDRRGLGTVSLLDPTEMAQVCSRLGPDALEISLTELTARLQTTARPVKVALLDQALIAGIGNLYASEILHLSRIHPEIPAGQLTRPQLKRLHAAIREVLELAIQYEGSTLSDGTYRNVLAQDGSYQNEHRVYDRAGEPCPGCQRLIVRLVQAQRSTFYCPGCQRRKPD